MGNPIRRRSSSRNSLTQTMIDLHHSYSLSPNQCSSRLIQKMDSPVHQVWSIIRRFENPQAYKPFIRSCSIRSRRIGVGSTREVTVISGLPAKNSIKRLDQLDDCDHVMSFTIVGGDHRLKNYHSTITSHEEEEEEEEEVEGRGKKTVVIESYVVDVPDGSNEEDTCLFVDTIVGCNLKSLAKIVEQNSQNLRVI